MTGHGEDAQPEDDDPIAILMLAVMCRQHYEADYGDRRPDYLLALDWVLDNWRSEDDPERQHLSLIARAISDASALDAADIGGESNCE